MSSKNENHTVRDFCKPLEGVFMYEEPIVFRSFGCMLIPGTQFTEFKDTNPPDLSHLLSINNFEHGGKV